MNRIPVIDMTATGINITRLRVNAGLTVKDLQDIFGFSTPQAIYKWQRGQSLPSVDNLYALSNLLEVPMNEILVSAATKRNIVEFEQQAEPCCSNHFQVGHSGYGKSPMQLQPFIPCTVPAA